MCNLYICVGVKQELGRWCGVRLLRQGQESTVDAVVRRARPPQPAPPPHPTPLCVCWIAPSPLGQHRLQVGAAQTAVAAQQRWPRMHHPLAPRADLPAAPVAGPGAVAAAPLPAPPGGRQVAAVPVAVPPQQTSIGLHPEKANAQIDFTALWLMRQGTESDALEPMPKQHHQPRLGVPLWRPEKSCLAIQMRGTIQARLPVRWFCRPPCPYSWEHHRQ